ncbi:TetR/AcrR family transcriptional regulator [Pelagibacterium halotolerans]|uniref:Transcriptional regulator, TetR family protein n=1 Tax=Pelagibacterium halotolerans (strain DSM 22347 / JCM 15775 / CGMCC 1.7692 / B2) TaxID=1082931 RepID=G4RDH7_PELHB|nr:TetR/AcrR family transcriptional regulator [Pelagibacterium halotolerans]AEQ51778.1 transcriptional regulator, TetR family protein [Pelagibacterium halotolerans B2]QJR18410.1 TetR family transcriptional regulator [Pelagibacterium halotolerans]SEA23169.1 transcriptional regulator, TetR family [Pelagibacterium halotolerans]
MATFIEEARRRQIVEAAIAVLAHEGYARASLSRIAARAGISKSVITYHFDGKDEMFEAVFSHVADAAGAYMTPFLERAGDPAGQIAAYIRHQIAYMRDHRDELLAIGTLALNHGGASGTPDYIVRSAEEERTILTALVTDGQAAGQIRGDLDAEFIAGLISKTVEGGLSEWAWRPETDLSAYADQLIDLLERGMRADTKK